MDLSVSPTHGEQEMSVWNGHYECTCYHPLFVFNQFRPRPRTERQSSVGNRDNDTQLRVWTAPEASA